MAGTQPKLLELKPPLPRWSPDRARRVNLLCSRGIYGQTEVARKVANWRFQLADTIPTASIKLLHDRHTAECHFITDDWSSRVEGRHWQDYPLPQQSLSFLLAHEAWLQHFQLLFGIPWQIDLHSSIPSTTNPTDLTWHWRAECECQISEGLVRFDDEVLGSLSAQPFWHRTSVDGPARLQNLPIRLEATLPVIPMRGADLSQFQPGDILIGGRTRDLKKGIIRYVPSGTAIWVCELDVKSRSINISQEWQNHNQSRRVSMSDKQAKPKDQSNINDLPVEIEFRLGEVTMTLANFNNLQPGHTFTLDRPLQSDEVTVLANGMAIGRGSLVIIGEHLGVHLTDVGSHGSH